MLFAIGVDAFASESDLLIEEAADDKIVEVTSNNMEIHVFDEGSSHLFLRQVRLSLTISLHIGRDSCLQSIFLRVFGISGTSTIGWSSAG